MTARRAAAVVAAGRGGVRPGPAALPPAAPARPPAPGRWARIALGIRALASHWRRRPLQLATLLLGLVVATALWSGVQALNAEARASYDRAAAAIGGFGVASLVAAGGGDLAVETFARLRREGWPVSPMIEAEIEVAGRPIRLLGVEPLTLPGGTGAAPGLGADGLAAFMTGAGQTLAAPETAAQLGLAEGVEAASDRGRLPPLRLSPDLGAGVLVTDIGIAERLAGRPGRIDRLLIGPNAPDRLPEGLAGQLVRVDPEEAGDLARLTESFHLNLTAFGLLAFLVGLFIVHGAIGLAIEQRLAAIRTLRAMGLALGDVVAALAIELTALALIGGGAGLVAGYLLAAALLPDVAASLGGLYGADVPGTLTLAPAWWLGGLGIAVAGTGIAAAAGLARVAGLPLLSAALPEAWAGAAAARLRWQALAAAGAFALALALLAGDLGLAAGFLGMAAILVGAALALPPVLASLVGRAAARARGPEARWVWADARQQIGALSLALMALLLALGTNIGVGTMVESFRTTFTGWLEDRLAAEVYLRADTSAEAAALEAWLAARPEVAAVLAGRSAEIRLGGWPADVTGFTDHATYHERFPLLAALPEVWDRVAAGGAALVSEQQARRLGLAPGDRLALPTPGGFWEVEVAGLYADYGNPRGEVRVALAAFDARWPGVEVTGYGLRADPADVPALIAALEARFGLGQDRLIDQARLKAEALSIFERTFAVTAALNALTLTVAGIAMLTSLTALGTMRLPQVAPLWAMGLTARRIALLDLARTLALAGLTVLLALPLGLAVAWVLTAVINVEAFGWRLPVVAQPADWAALMAIALAAAAAAAAVPALWLARTPPARLVKVFADER